MSCNPAQQGSILEALGDQMTEEIERARNAAISEWAPEGNRNFYSMFRWLTLTAYYTSEQGATQELRYEVIPDRHDACVEETSGQRGPQPQ
jgi:hypothetical protein